MAISSEFTDFIVEQLQELDDVYSRRMFGGFGIFCNDVMFGLVADDVLYLKTNDQTKVRYEELGLGPFLYERAGKTVALKSYYEAPERLLDDREAMMDWAGEAIKTSQC